MTVVMVMVVMVVVAVVLRSDLTLSQSDCLTG